MYKIYKNYILYVIILYYIKYTKIKMDLREVGGGCGDWMELAQDRNRWRALVSMVRNLRVPKCREFLD